MLFTCQICRYGHGVLDVEAFKLKGTGQTVYRCKKHLVDRPDNLIHVPWAESSCGDCRVCGPSHLCYRDKSPYMKIHGLGEDFCIERSDN